MLYYAFVFLLVVILAAVFWFYDLAGKEEMIAKVLFVPVHCAVPGFVGNQTSPARLVASGSSKTAGVSRFYD